MVFQSKKRNARKWKKYLEKKLKPNELKIGIVKMRKTKEEIVLTAKSIED